MKVKGLRCQGLWRHFLLTLRLNFRSRQAVVYGYLVPLLFLVGFGSVFRAEDPPLLAQMGQVLTITILGGACFGMPTALVAERERGIWRRYRLLPVGKAGLLAGVLVARLLLVFTALAVQVAAARYIYGTPWPSHPVEIILLAVLVTICFLGLGMVVAALAPDVPAVQALGQCLFLPMILIGGVGVPLAALPGWAQRTAGFFPGRYAVTLLESGYRNAMGAGPRGFDVFAVLAIGAAAAAVGFHLFRWEGGGRRTAVERGWVAGALGVWILVGIAASATGANAPLRASSKGYEHVDDAEMAGVTFDNLPGDDEIVSRLSPPFDAGDPRRGMARFAADLQDWAPGHVPDSAQAARNLLAVAAVGDVSEDSHEGEIARLVFDDLRRKEGDRRLARILTWIILYPEEGRVVISAPELGLARSFSERIIRERVSLYARKFLGRLEGRIRD